MIFSGPWKCAQCGLPAPHFSCDSRPSTGWMSERMGVPRQQGAPNILPSQQQPKRTP